MTVNLHCTLCVCMYAKPELACEIVKCCVALHNFIINVEGPAEDADIMQYLQDRNDELHSNDENEVIENDNRRRQLIDYFI